MNRQKPLMSAAVALLLLLSLAFLPAAKESAKETRRRELQQKIKAADQQAKSISQQIAESDGRRAALEKEINGLTSRIRDAESRLAASEAALGVAREELVTTEGNLTVTHERVDQLRDRIAQRGRDTYKSRPASLVGVPLSADDLRGLLGRVGYLGKVMTEDQRRVSALENLSTQLEASRTEIVQRKTDITTEMHRIETEKANIAKMRESLRVSREAVQKEIAHHKDLLTKVQSDKASYLREMAELEKASQGVGALLRNRQKGQVFQAGSGKKLAWPTTGKLSSPYGYRTHPVFKDRRLHTGVDVSAPSGQAVIAAEAGTVVYAGTRSGYGLSVVIDHGNALGTLYAHMSGLNVSTGQKVGRGVRVGSVGCTGYCTGPHLHFETRINGDPRDPMQFF